MTFEQILNEREQKSFAQGHAQGHAEGLTEGAAQKQREIAKSMMKEGISKKIITKTTGLSEEEVENL